MTEDDDDESGYRWLNQYEKTWQVYYLTCHKPCIYNKILNKYQFHFTLRLTDVASKLDIT